MNQCSDDIHGCYATRTPFCTGVAPQMILSHWTCVRVALDVRAWQRNLFMARVRRTMQFENDRVEVVERPRWSRLRPNRSRVCRGGRAYAGSRITLCPGLSRGSCT